MRSAAVDAIRDDRCVTIDPADAGDDATRIRSLLDRAVSIGEARPLADWIMARSGLPGPRLDLRVVHAVARAIGEAAVNDATPVGRLEALVDSWAHLSADEAPGDQPEVMLPCAAVAAYGEVGAVRPEWWDDEIGKLRTAAGDPRWRVREVVAQALQRLLEADWRRTVEALQGWAADADPLVVRAAAAALAEPRLLQESERAFAAADVERRAVAAFVAILAQERRDESVRVLRQALGFTLSVAIAATGDFSMLDGLARSRDADLRWIVRQNLAKGRLQRWPEQVARVRALLDDG